VSRSALLRIALLALIWGSAFLWIKLADRGFSPVEVTLARLALGSVVLFAIMRTRRETIPRSARLWAHIAVAVTRRRRPGFNPGGLAVAGRAASPRPSDASPTARRQPAHGTPVTGRLRSPPYPAAAPASTTARPKASRQMR
jgi:hypothetical protein